MAGRCSARRLSRADADLIVNSAYLAAEGLERPLAESLARAGVSVAAWHGRLAMSSDPPLTMPWALDAWTAPREIDIPSISAGAAALRALQRNWSHLPHLQHRRSALIAERRPMGRAKPLTSPPAAPPAPLGVWTLLAPDRMLASPTKTSPWPNGACRFLEDRSGPPSRAYLKLWEACTVFGASPQAGQHCLDLGAAPGGWTWAIAQCGADVLAIDRAPLAESVAAMPGVTQRRENAFVLLPESMPPVDWLFSDVIAYPSRLLALVERWIDSRRAARIVATLKFQGATDHGTAEAFAAIPGGRLVHLFHNKHELTFLWAGALL